MSAQGSFRPVPAWATEVELFSVAGADGFLREANGRFAGLLGVEAAALSDRSLLELVHPDDVPEVVAGLAALEAGATEVLLESRFRQQGGGWTYLEWVARPLDGTDLWWAAGRDTTRYHLMKTEGAPASPPRPRGRTGDGGDVELDVREGRLTWEPQAAMMLGLPVDGLPDTMADLAAVVHPQDASVVLSAEAGLMGVGRTDVEGAGRRGRRHPPPVGSRQGPRARPPRTAAAVRRAARGPHEREGHGATGCAW